MKEVRVIGVLNKNDTNPRIGMGEEAIDFAKDLKNIHIPGISIGQRVSYRRAIADGMSVCELTGKKKDQKAIEEIKLLYKEVFKDA